MKTWWKNFLIRMLVRRKWLRAIVDELGKRISSLINNSFTRVKSWWVKIPRFTTLFVGGFVGLVWLINKTITVMPEIEIKSVPHEYWWWMLGILGVIAVGTLLWFAAKNSAIRKGATTVGKSKWFLWPVVIILMVVAYHKIPDYFPNGFWGTEEPAIVIDTTYHATVTPDKPVEVTMNVGWRMDVWGEVEKLDKEIKWSGQKKIQVFKTKPGVDKVELKIRVYPCAAQAPC